MSFDPACIPCIINQANNSAKLFLDGNKSARLQILKEVCLEVQNIEDNFTAPMFSSIIQNLIEKNLGITDPYKQAKEFNLRTAQKFLPYLDTMVKGSINKIEMGVRAAIIGNTIDLGANPNFNIENEVNRILSNDIILSELNSFINDLENSSLILYIADNYEEALFDKILLKVLGSKKIIFAVRSKPILNDITLAEANHLGINKICEVIESGSTIGGTDLSMATEEFMHYYNTADLVISKGQGNYETLMDEKRPIWFMFKVKCDVISTRCGFPVGKGILLFNQKVSKGRQ
jgi:damage-control phosphatase, subfamily I